MSNEPIAWRRGPLRRPGRSEEIMFGQVREDISLEAGLAKGSALVVASGGDLAFELLAQGIDRVVAVDVNPAQVFLVLLKMAIFEQCEYEEALGAFTSDAGGAYARVRATLDDKVIRFFDARGRALSRGLQNCGMVDAVFPKLVRLLELFIHRRWTVDSLLSQPSLDGQRRFFDETWNTHRWRLATRIAFCATAFRLVLGRQFSRSIPAGFGREFLSELNTVLTEAPIKQNPYVWQAFRQQYPEGGLPFWLTEAGFRIVKSSLKRLEVVEGDVAKVAAERARRSFDFVALTNVLDVSNLEQTTKLAEGLCHALAADGLIVARSFFSPESGLVEASGGKLKTVAKPSWTDRSFFCRHFELLSAGLP